MPEDVQSVRRPDLAVAVRVAAGDAVGLAGEAHHVPEHVQRIDGVERAAAINVTTQPAGRGRRG